MYATGIYYELVKKIGLDADADHEQIRYGLIEAVSHPRIAYTQRLNSEK